MGLFNGNKPAIAGKDDIDIPGIRTMSSLAYVSDAQSGHFLDVYWSKEPASPIPLIIYFNSTSFSHTNRGRAGNLCKSLAKRGYTVVDAEFRDLKKGVSLQDEFEDIRKMLDWLRLNHERFDIDMDNVYVVGAGYGALMALWLTMMCTSGRCSAASGMQDAGIEVRGLGLFHGKTDIESDDQVMKRIRSELRKLSETDRELKESLVFWENHDVRTIPPVFQVTYDRDTSREDVVKMDGLLENSRIPHELLDYESSESVGRMFMERKAASNESIRAVSRMLNLFKDYQ